VASVLSLGLPAGPAVVFGTTAWHLVTGAGTTAFSRPVAVVFLVLVVFRPGRRKGRERPAAAVPAVLTLLGSSAAPFAVPCLVVAYGD
jgi:hypothetical protein